MKYKYKERKHMEFFGGRRLPSSGRGLPWDDGVILNYYHVQLKVTKKGYYELRAADLAKLFKHAIIWGQEPLFMVYFESYGIYALVFWAGAADPEEKNQKSRRIYPKIGEYDVTMVKMRWKVFVAPPLEAKEIIYTRRNGAG